MPLPQSGWPLPGRCMKTPWLGVYHVVPGETCNDMPEERFFLTFLMVDSYCSRTRASSYTSHIISEASPGLVADAAFRLKCKLYLSGI